MGVRSHKACSLRINMKNTILNATSELTVYGFKLNGTNLKLLIGQVICSERKIK